MVHRQQVRGGRPSYISSSWRLLKTVWSPDMPVRRMPEQSIVPVPHSGYDRLLLSALKSPNGSWRTYLNGALLSSWSGAISKGMPAVLLNATEVETGRPLAFSSTSLNSYGIVDFAATYGRDPDIPTAVRLSATFPFVTPVARLDGQDADNKPFPHLADGSYYDNYGMYSLMAWLNEALAGTANPPEVLVVRIEAFPLGVETTVPQGWPFQTWAPLTTMMSVRKAAHQRRNDTHFQLFQQQYRRGSIREMTFRYQPPCGCGDPPLSWDLSPPEIECLNRAWEGKDIQSSAELVRNFVESP